MSPEDQANLDRARELARGLISQRGVWPDQVAVVSVTVDVGTSRCTVSVKDLDQRPVTAWGVTIFRPEP